METRAETVEREGNKIMSSLLAKKSTGTPITHEELMAKAALRPTEINVINATQAIKIEAGRQSMVLVADIGGIVAEYKAAGKEIKVNGLSTDRQIEAMQR